MKHKKGQARTLNRKSSNNLFYPLMQKLRQIKKEKKNQEDRMDFREMIFCSFVLLPALSDVHFLCW